MTTNNKTIWTTNPAWNQLRELAEKAGRVLHFDITEGLFVTDLNNNVVQRFNDLDEVSLALWATIVTTYPFEVWDDAKADYVIRAAIETNLLDELGIFVTFDEDGDIIARSKEDIAGLSDRFGLWIQRAAIEFVRSVAAGEVEEAGK